MSKFKPCALTPDQKQAVEIARIGFMAACPFYSHFFFAECKELPTLDIPTAATDGRTIYYNPEYLASLKPAEAVFVLAHEMAHVVNRHPQRMKSYERDGKVGSKPFHLDTFNTAADYVINAGLMDEGIGMMNASWLYDPNTSGEDLPENVYERIYKKPPPPNPNGQGQGQAPGPKGKTFGDSPKAPKGSKADKVAAGQGGAFDTLLEPSVDAVTGAEDLPDEAEFKEAVARAAAAAKAIGKMPASLQRLVDSILEPQIDWKEHVRMLMTGHVGSRKETWERPNRRRLALNPIIITPGRRGHGADTVAMVIDNSGSISEKELAAAFAEIGAVLADVRPKRVILIWCDAKVQQVDEAASLDELDTIRVKGSPGGGGTSFIPPFTWLAEHEIQPETLVYITDGLGSFPNEPAPFPVVWAVTTAQPVPWGDVVRIKL